MPKKAFVKNVNNIFQSASKPKTRFSRTMSQIRKKQYTGFARHTTKKKSEIRPYYPNQRNKKV